MPSKFLSLQIKKENDFKHDFNLHNILTHKRGGGEKRKEKKKGRKFLLYFTTQNFI